MKNIHVLIARIKVIYGVLKYTLKESIKILRMKELQNLNIKKNLSPMLNMDAIQEKHNLFPYKSIIEL